MIYVWLLQESLHLSPNVKLMNVIPNAKLMNVESLHLSPNAKLMNVIVIAFKS